jgi:hypothetical protein
VSRPQADFNNLIAGVADLIVDSQRGTRPGQRKLLGQLQMLVRPRPIDNRGLVIGDDFAGAPNHLPTKVDAHLFRQSGRNSPARFTVGTDGRRTECRGTETLNAAAWENI